MIRVDRGELTRNEIIRVAANRFLNDGYTKTTVASMAKSLNMSTGNMTFYFPTKDHMLAELVDMLGKYQWDLMENEAKEENYDYEYIRPQESGSHYACKYLAVKNLFKVTAEQPFSCSVNPFTTEQLRETLHSFELEENDFVNVCIDLAMRGVGSHSCGPDLPDEYEIPKEYKNTFKFTF